LTTKQLKKIAKTIKPKGIHGEVFEIRNNLTSSKVDPFLIIDDKEESNNHILQEEYQLNEDVSYYSVTRKFNLNP